MKVAETATVAPLSLASAAAETVRWLLNGRHALAMAVEDGCVRRTALTYLLLHAEPIGDQTFRLADGVAAPFFDAADRDSPAVLFLLPDRDGLPVAVLLVVTDAVPEAERLMVAASVARQAAFGLECVGLAERSARLLAKEHLLAELGREVGATLALSVIVAALEARVMTVFGAGVVLTADAQGRFAPPPHRQLAALSADRCAELTAIAAVADTATI